MDCFRVCLATVHPRHHTPHIAILFYAAIGCLFALTGTFRQLAVVASGSILLVYLGVSLAVIGLRRRMGPPSPGQFRIPGGPTVPVLSSGVILWLLSQMTASEATGCGGTARSDGGRLLCPQCIQDISALASLHGAHGAEAGHGDPPA